MGEETVPEGADPTVPTVARRYAFPDARVVVLYDPATADSDGARSIHCAVGRKP